MPWSGRVLGLTDLGFVAGRRKPLLLAIMGAHNAGKTTLLGAWYLLLGSGSRPKEGLRFSGSCSLGGWEELANPLRWKSGSIPPTFPPHTPSTSARSPGLLHLAFKRKHDRRTDYLITDAPGEWFRKWAIRSDHPDARGAQWAAEHADAFLLVADRKALSGPEKGAARTGIHLLARRIGAELRERPVALVWTKADIPIPNEMEEAVRSAVLRVLPQAVEFSVSIASKPDGTEYTQDLLDLLRWVLDVSRPAIRLPEPVSRHLDPLFTFGTR